MEDKIFNLLEKMYNEMNKMRKDIKTNNDQISDMRKDIKNNNDQISDMRKDIKTNNDQIMEVQKNMARLENNLIKNTLIIENDVMPKINALFDGYVQNTEMFHRIEAKVDHLTKIVERHDVEIKFIKGAK